MQSLQANTTGNNNTAVGRLCSALQHTTAIRQHGDWRTTHWKTK